MPPSGNSSESRAISISTIRCQPLLPLLGLSSCEAGFPCSQPRQGTDLRGVAQRTQLLVCHTITYDANRGIVDLFLELGRALTCGVVSLAHRLLLRETAENCARCSCAIRLPPHVSSIFRHDARAAPSSSTSLLTMVLWGVISITSRAGSPDEA